MAYSAGDYQQKDYKTGLAFSDTLLPAAGSEYRRLTLEDTTGIWGQPGHLEVRYLLQSQKTDWPNYIAAQVIAPGVPSIVQEPSGRWLLFFDGFLPSNATLSCWQSVQHRSHVTAAVLCAVSCQYSGKRKRDSGY